MKITIDYDKCIGAGQCVVEAPEVFDQSEDDGVVFMLVDSVLDSSAAAVRSAAHACPARIIHIDEE